jgi:hypothetical protein
MIAFAMPHWTTLGPQLALLESVGEFWEAAGEILFFHGFQQRSTTGNDR